MTTLAGTILNLEFEFVEITNTTMHNSFSLYYVDDQIKNIFTYGSKGEIARRYCESKGINIKMQAEENGICRLYANDKEYARIDCKGVSIEDCYYLFFPLNDKDFKVYGLKEFILPKNIRRL